MGINIRNRFLPPLEIMDDITTILPKHRLGAWYEWRGPPTAKWGLSFKIPKDQVLHRGCGNTTMP